MSNIIQPVRNLPNGTRINAIEHIYQAAKPTTRIDGSALVVGDKWYNPSTGIDGFWNGTYWLSSTLSQVGIPFRNAANTTSTTYIQLSTSTSSTTIGADKFLITRLYHRYTVSGGSYLVKTNITDAVPVGSDLSSYNVYINEFNTNDGILVTPSNIRKHYIAYPNVYVDSTTPGWGQGWGGYCFPVTFFKNNVSGSLLSISTTLNYREVL